MNKPLTYLAAPYSHPDLSVKHARFLAINKAAAKLINSGTLVFSPISHSHPIAMAGDLPGDWEFWNRFCIAYLSHCNEMLVLTLDGWETSVGIANEIRLAKEFGIPIKYVSEEDYGN